MLLAEKSGYVPNYMTITRDEWATLSEAFKNFLGTISTSIQSLYQTIIFNVKFVIDSFKGDQQKLQKTFIDFSKKRAEIRGKTEQYLSSYYETSGIRSNNWSKISGTLLFALAANPFMTLSSGLQKAIGWSGDKLMQNAAVANISLQNQQTNKQTTGGKQALGIQISKRFKKIIDIFGISEKKSWLFEAKEMSSDPKKLQELAHEYFEQQTKKILELQSAYKPRANTLREIKYANSLNDLVKIFEKNKLDVSKINASINTLNIQIEKFLKNEEFINDIEKKLASDANFKNLSFKEKLEKITFLNVINQIIPELDKMLQIVVDQFRSDFEIDLRQDTKEALAESEDGQRYIKIVSNFENMIKGVHK